MSQLARGVRFRHDRFREAVPGVRVADSPHQVMRVTRVTNVSVYYRRDDEHTRGDWVMDRADAERRFAPRIIPSTEER